MLLFNTLIMRRAATTRWAICLVNNVGLMGHKVQHQCAFYKPLIFIDLTEVTHVNLVFLIILDQKMIGQICGTAHCLKIT